MLDLTFFTSNPVKLAHARFLAEGRPLRINGFRERTYHATYNEPRLSSRDELLRASYLSAVEQTKKAGLLTSRHFFILEDTSVRIDALSRVGHEVPGLDVKYWMRKATFKSLDASIRKAGGDRSATVRSDIVLHIPPEYRERWRIDSDYLVFVGEQKGSIVEHETSFETNLVFPWLDNTSFNKWFVPEGADAPAGQLPIDVAQKLDFRQKSFGRLFDFLSSKQLLVSPNVQTVLPLGSERNFIVCGYTCAGKTTASQYLARYYDYLHVEASDFMHLAYHIRHDAQGDIPIGDFAEKALAAKPEIAAEKIAEYLGEDPLAPTVISGFRSPEEVTWLTKHFVDQGKQFRVIFIDSPEAKRFDRMNARNRGGDVRTIEQFKERDEQQRRMGLDKICAAADTVWINDSTQDAYFTRLDEASDRPKLPEPDVDTWLAELQGVRAVKLEDAILVALLSKWSDDETRAYFTTAEIARIANDLLSVSAKKHKDNVSRYFNQYFYAYYEIAIDGERGARRYRLSNTGYGKALRTLRRIVGGATRSRQLFA